MVPDWPRLWLAGTRTTIVLPLITIPGGFLILLAALRWRRGDARMLAVLAVVPQSTNFYEGLYPLTVASTFREAGALTILSWIGFVGMYVISPRASYDVWIRTSALMLVWFVYLPAVFLVFRRPAHDPPTGASNEATVSSAVDAPAT